MKRLLIGNNNVMLSNGIAYKLCVNFVPFTLFTSDFTVIYDMANGQSSGE